MCRTRGLKRELLHVLPQLTVSKDVVGTIQPVFKT
jgi:hypothetical protein